MLHFRPYIAIRIAGILGYVARAILVGAALLLPEIWGVSSNVWAKTSKTTEPTSSPILVSASGQRRIEANSSNYLYWVKRLRAGDTLVLQPGIYDDPNSPPGLPIFDLHGEPGRPIVITGPDQGPRPELRARATHNTIRIANASYIVIRDLVLDGRGAGVDGVKAQGVSHHITLEDLVIKNHGGNQQAVGISTKGPAWNWVVRRNVVIGAGTGMYFGHPDGSWPFVGGLIENNVVVDTLGYNIQIKHQRARKAIAGMPLGRSITTIRHNVLSKRNNGSTGTWARPNLLVGHFPPNGPGVEDFYEIYGNFFFENPTEECLFQGEGNIALYNNVFVNRRGNAVCIRPHNDRPRQVFVFRNTILASGVGIELYGPEPACTQQVVGNAVFAAVPIVAAVSEDDITDSFAAADKYLANPGAELGTLNLFPNGNRLMRKPIDIAVTRNFTDGTLDFSGRLYDARDRGAYTRGSKSSGWLPTVEIKPLSSRTMPSPETVPSCRVITEK